MQQRKDGGETRVRTERGHREHPENRTKGAEPQEDAQEQRQGTAAGAGDEGGFGRHTET